MPAKFKALRCLILLGLCQYTLAKADETVLMADDQVQVYSESTSFSEMLQKKATQGRAPASIESVARVIAVHRELGMSSEESNRAAQDIVLNGGANSGLSEGMIMSVVRKIPVIDPYRENAQTELEVPFAKIKIIHVQKDVAVARLASIESSDQGMFLGTRGILVGDFISTEKK